MLQKAILTQDPKVILMLLLHTKTPIINIIIIIIPLILCFLLLHRRRHLRECRPSLSCNCWNVCDSFFRGVTFFKCGELTDFWGRLIR